MSQLSRAERGTRGEREVPRLSRPRLLVLAPAPLAVSPPPVGDRSFGTRASSVPSRRADLSGTPLLTLGVLRKMCESVFSFVAHVLHVWPRCDPALLTLLVLSTTSRLAIRLSHIQTRDDLLLSSLSDDPLCLY